MPVVTWLVLAQPGGKRRSVCLRRPGLLVIIRDYFRFPEHKGIFKNAWICLQLRILNVTVVLALKKQLPP